MDSEGNEIQDIGPNIDDILNKINNNQYEHVGCDWEITDIVTRPKKQSIKSENPNQPAVWEVLITILKTNG